MFSVKKTVCKRVRVGPLSGASPYKTLSSSPARGSDWPPKKVPESMSHDVTYEPVNFVISAEQVC